MPGWRDNLNSNWSRVEGSTREFLGRLTSSQRISLAVLAAVVIVGMSFIIALGRGEAEALEIGIGPTDSDGKSILAEKLREKNVPVELLEDKILVEPKYRPVVDSVMAADAELQKHPDFFKWLDDTPSWQETSGRQQARIFRSTIQRVEAAIGNWESVERASVHVPLREQSLFVRSAIPTTAAVQIQGVVSSPQARAIQGLVGAAFSVPAGAVTISDSRGLVALDDDSMLFDQESKIRKRYMDNVHNILGQALHPGVDYSVSVSPTINRSKATESLIVYDADKSVSLTARKTREKDESRHGLRAPGTEPNVVRGGSDRPAESDSLTTVHEREEVENDNRFAETTRTTQLPSGEIESLNIVVWISTTALSRHAKATLDKEEVDSTDVEDERRRFETAIKALVADSQVPSSVRVWTSVPRSELVQSDLGEEEEAVAGYIEVHSREITLIVLSIIGCFLLYRIATRSVPQVETLSDPVANLREFLEQKEESERKREVEEEETARAEPQIDWETTDEDREAIELLKAVTEFAQERPELAATVLRSWVSDPPEETTAKSEAESKT